MKTYYFYSKRDESQEPIYYCKASSRLRAAEKFAQGKQLPLKVFLNLFSVSQ